MELNYLREFVVLAQTCHYQETADRLFISQPTLSKHIKTMEAELGAELFKRTSRRVELSEFGRAFLPYAQRIAAIQEEYTSALLRELQWKGRRMAVGISPLVTLHSLQPFLTDFAQANPDDQIDLVERDDMSLRRLLRSGRCTLVIAAQSPRFDDREFAALPYGEDILVALMTEAHPLAGRTAVTGEDLADETILQLEETGLASCLEGVRKIRTVARQSILADLVLSGMGVGILTQNAARHFERPGLVRVPITPEVVVRLNVLTPKNGKLPFPAKELLKFVKGLKRAAPPVPRYNVTKTRAIFLDLDDTILDFGRAEASALRRVLTEEGIPAGDAVLARYHDINAAQWALLEEGKITRPQVLIRRFDILFKELGVTGDSEAVCERYEEYLASEVWFVPGAEALLETLAPRYGLYIASNGTATVQHRRLAASGIGKYVQKVFISQEMRADKPSPAFFDACFAAVPGLSRQEALMVGDSLTSDIRGGRNAGMATCWFNPQKKPGREDIRPDFEIHALEELPRLLAGE